MRKALERPPPPRVLPPRSDYVLKHALRDFERATLGFDRLRVRQPDPMAKHCRRSLSLRTHCSRGLRKPHATRMARPFARRQLIERSRQHGHGETCIAARNRMTDPVRLVRVEEQHLIGIGDVRVAAGAGGHGGRIGGHGKRILVAGRCARRLYGAVEVLSGISS